MKKLLLINSLKILSLAIIFLFSVNNAYSSIKFRVSKLPLFEKLLCRNEDFSFIEFDNFTNEDGKIDSIKILGKNASEFKIEDDDKIIIPAYQKTRLKILFKPDSDGKKNAEMIIYSSELENNYMDKYNVNLFSEKLTSEIKFREEWLDFGDMVPDSIGERIIYVRNTGSLPIDFSKMQLPINAETGHFQIIDISPKVLLPWQETNIDGIFVVRFKATDEKTYTDEFKFRDICNNDFSFKVKAKVKKNTPTLDPVSLIVENYNASSGDEIEIKVKIFNYYVLKSQNITRLISNLKFNNTILYPISNTPIGEIDGNFRKIKLEFDITKDSIFTLKFKVALGTDSATKLELYDTFSPGFINQIDDISGEFKLNDLCNAAGPRLVKVDEIIKLSIKIQENDFAEINYQLIENGLTQIYLYDYYGNLLDTIIDKNMNRGEHISIINFNKYGNGIFYIYFKTPTYSNAFNIILIR